MRDEIVRFLVAGAANTGATYLLYWLLLRIIDYRLSYSISYVAGIGIGYWLNSRFVFRCPMSLRGLLQYPVVYAIQFLLGLAMIWVLVGRLGCDRRVAMLIVIAVSVPLSFALNRYVIVRSSARCR